MLICYAATTTVTADDDDEKFGEAQNSRDFFRFFFSLKPLNLFAYLFNGRR